MRGAFTSKLTALISDDGTSVEHLGSWLVRCVSDPIVHQIYVSCMHILWAINPLCFCVTYGNICHRQYLNYVGWRLGTLVVYNS